MPFLLPTEHPDRSAFQAAATNGVVTDAERLIQEAFRQGDRQGYELLFRRYYRPLCSQAARFVYSRELAEDLVGDVFLAFWKSDAHRHITTSYRAYLFRAVRNRALSHLHDELRQDAVFDRVPASIEDPITDDDPQQILQLTELYQRLEQEIQALPPQCQRVFLLSRYEGRKHREIADELHISLKTVEGHLMKALSHLRKVLLALMLSEWLLP